MTKQYLFNIKLFKDRWEEVPGILCFPTYFLYTIITILNTYKLMNENIFKSQQKEAIKTLFEGWFYSLPEILNILINNNNITLASPEEFHNILWDASEQYVLFKTPITTDLFALEYYMKKDEDKKYYRKIINTINLRTNNVTTICDLIKYLTAIKCCPMVEEGKGEGEDLPESLQYTKINTETYSGLQGPAEWGPYYWKIFHTIAEYSDNSYLLDAFPSILSVTVPCPSCQVNYLRHIQPSTIPLSSENYLSLYNSIHNRVSEHRE